MLSADIIDEITIGTKETLVLLVKRSFDNKDYVNVLNLFKIAFSLYEFDTPLAILRYARTSYNNLIKIFNKDIGGIQDYWKMFTLPYMKSVHTLIQVIVKQKDLDIPRVKNQFISIINSSNLNDIYKKCYLESFEIFTNSFVDDILGNQKLFIPFNHNTNKVIIAGIKYSGSSAVYDFLKEFKDVSLLNIEKPILENKKLGFINLINKFEDKQLQIEDVINFYFVNIICCTLIFDSNYYTQIRFNFRELRAVKNKTAYLELILSCSTIISNIIREIRKGDHTSKSIILSLLKQLGNFIVDLSFVDFPSTVTPISRTLFHIDNMKILNYIDNITFIPVLRDPRSRYVSYISDDFNDISIDRYIKESLNSYKKYEQELTSISQQSGSNNLIYPISFEDFVLNEEYRIELLGKIGINISQHVYPKKFFVVDDSIKNVYNFINYSNQDEISCIKSQLDSYCYKFDEQP